VFSQYLIVIIHGVSGTINSKCKISRHTGLNVNSSQSLLLFRGSGLIILKAGLMILLLVSLFMQALRKHLLWLWSIPLYPSRIYHTKWA